MKERKTVCWGVGGDPVYIINGLGLQISCRLVEQTMKSMIKSDLPKL